MREPPCEIRTATENDLDALAGLFIETNRFHAERDPGVFVCPEDSSSARERLISIMSDEASTVITAECDEQVIGFVMIVPGVVADIPVLAKRRYALVDTLAVSEAFRGRGIGRALMGAAHLWAIEQGFEQIELSVCDFNERARGLYESLSYETAYRRMRKRLR